MSEDEKALRDYLDSLTREQLTDLTVNLSKDAERLRRELDDATGVIR